MLDAGETGSPPAAQWQLRGMPAAELSPAVDSAPPGPAHPAAEQSAVASSPRATQHSLAEPRSLPPGLPAPTHTGRRSLDPARWSAPAVASAARGQVQSQTPQPAVGPVPTAWPRHNGNPAPYSNSEPRIATLVASQGSPSRCAVPEPQPMPGFRHSLSPPRLCHRRSYTGYPKPKTSPVSPPESPGSSTACPGWPPIPWAGRLCPRPRVPRVPWERCSKSAAPVAWPQPRPAWRR